MLRIDGVEFAHGKGPQVLNGTTMQASAGSVTAVVGPNGSGKSTLIKCVAGVWRPQSGTIAWQGRDLARLGRGERARLVGWLPQSTWAAFPLTVLDSVLLGRHPYRATCSRAENERAAIAALARLDLLDLAERPLGTLSGGQAQLVGMARMLAQEPRVMLLDEPTSAMDLRHVLQSADVVRDVAQRDRVCILLAIHDLTAALRIADHVVMLDRGSVRAAGRPEEVITATALADVYRIDASVGALEGTRVVAPHRALDA